MNQLPDWLKLRRGEAPLVISLPHTGTDIPAPIQPALRSLWLARKDADWWIETLYDFAGEHDATVIRTSVSRTVIDVNRDPSGLSLYPGQATTDLCPTTSFDGEPLYHDGGQPDAAEIERRKATYFTPYHDLLGHEIARLRTQHPAVVLYDCHSIRSVIPRLFDGTLPHFNIGTNSGLACDDALTQTVEAHCAATGLDVVVNGRFKGGSITRLNGKPEAGVHAIQMELACRTYLDEPLGDVSEQNWPTPYDPAYAAPVRATLRAILQSCLDFARS
jgi:formiminoglutamase